MTSPISPPATGRPHATKSKANKRLANGLVAVSSAAIVAVYAAGYIRSAPAAANVASTAPTVAIIATTPPVPVAAAQLPPTATLTPVPATVTPTLPTAAPTTTSFGATSTTGSEATAIRVIAPTATTAVPTATRTAQTTQAGAAFRDGTYTGLGSSRHGSIQATVVIQGGRITSAEITNCGTRYPCSKVATLPGEVVARQSANVDTISGATDSTNAYRSAVTAALAQAH